MNYSFVGNCDITQIVEVLNSESNDIWLEHKYRQNNTKTHKDTNTVELFWDKDSLYSGNIGKIHPTNYLKFNIPTFLELLRPLYEKAYGKGYFVRALLVKMLPNSRILPHKDNGKSLISCKRTHIPVVTNKNVLFTVNGETKHLQEGEIWEINNTVMHSVVNNSKYCRIHLIIDYTEDKKNSLQDDIS